MATPLDSAHSALSSRVLKDMAECMAVLASRRLVNSTVYVACESQDIATMVEMATAVAMPAAPRPNANRVGDLYVLIYGAGPTMDHFILCCREGYILNPEISLALREQRHTISTLYISPPASAAPAAAAAAAAAAPAAPAKKKKRVHRATLPDVPGEPLGDASDVRVNTERLTKMETDKYFNAAVKRLENHAGAASTKILELAKTAVAVEKETAIAEMRVAAQEILEAHRTSLLVLVRDVQTISRETQAAMDEGIRVMNAKIDEIMGVLNADESRGRPVTRAKRG